MKFYVEVMRPKVASITPKWRTFKLLWWVQLLNRLEDLDEILYGGDDINDIDAIFSNYIPSTFQSGGRLNL
jgi:hypothetical protein